ncbi:MAG: Rrf2 family transcriptional regulator [Cohaesibacteraceae bacterium]
MKRNSKLSLALHAMGHMAREPDKRFRSEDIAAFHQTNPVVVRRVLGRMRELDLVTSEKGHSGGWQLAKPATDIALSDIYVGLADKQFRVENSADTHCAVERALFNAFEDAMSEAERTLIDRLRSISLQNIADEMDNKKS